MRQRRREQAGDVTDLLVGSERIPPGDSHDVDAGSGRVGGILPGASNPVTYACPVPLLRDGHDAMPVRRTVFPPVAREEDPARTHRVQAVTEDVGRDRGAVVVPRGQRPADPEEHLASLSCSVEIGAYPLNEVRRVHVAQGRCICAGGYFFEKSIKYEGGRGGRIDCPYATDAWCPRRGGWDG